MEFFWTCCMSFGIGLAGGSAFSLRDSIWLIRHGDRVGWIGPGAVAAGLVMAAAGFIGGAG